MKLKSLELQGFKTFPDKTKLQFEDGISAVVGPNGSGKSNISDAMRWVLGEQSARVLRCNRMEDVIFSGTPGRKAQGFAEVTLNIDNSSRYLPYDDDAVAVTRRYYRSGESEYMINRATVRLKDIHELFMDTGLGRDGYSMIGQGKIDSIISAKSEERREIFEEAAGISRYRYRKEEAERKLQRAEENLVRLEDILSELEGRIGPLREQSEKAKTYLALYAEKRSLEIGLWLFTLNQSGTVLKEQEEKIGLVKSQHEEVAKEAEMLDRQIDDLFRKTNLCLAEAEQERAASAKAEGDALAKDGEISVFQNEIRHNEETINRLREEQIRNREEFESRETELAESRDRIRIQEQEIRERKDELRKTEEALGEMQKHMEISGEQQQVASGQLDQLTADSAQEQLAAAQADSTIREIRLRADGITDSVAEKTEQLRSLEQELREQEEQVRNLLDEETGHQEELRAGEERLQKKAEQQEQLRKEHDSQYLNLQETGRRISILEDLERNLEGFANSVKTVMRLAGKGELKGIHGPVTRLMSVTNTYAAAIETALGSAAQHIVVDSEEAAKQAIGLLKKQDGGRATFLPLTTIRGRRLDQQNLRNTPGFIGIAEDLCSCEEQYREIIRSLLGRIVIADTLDHAVGIAKQNRYQFRIVTLDGQVVNAGGSMTGGSLLRKNGLLSRSAKISDLKKQKAEQESRYREIQKQYRDNEALIRDLREEIREGRESAAQLTARRIHAESALRELRSELDGRQVQIRELQTEKQYSDERVQDLLGKKKEAQDRMLRISGQVSELQKQLQKISGGQSEIQQKIDTLTETMQDLRFRLLSLNKDQEVLEESTGRLELLQEQNRTRSQEIQTEIVRAEERDTTLAQDILSAQQEAAQLREKAQSCREQAEAKQNERLMLEKRTTELRSMEKERSATKETIAQELTRLEERKISIQKRYDEIIEQLWTEYELTRREAEQEGESVENEAEASKRLRSLKNRIKALGNVNVEAIEEYAEVSQRYTFLREQVDDVEKSRTELRSLIRSLTSQMTEIFRERFQEIDRYFQTTFRDLFGGGSAHLELSEPDDILNSGIVILAQPPGKIVKNLELLSGGEKAMVAVSLYFSIMKVSPPPFCMLDEIEAALDDVNVIRFAEYLRKMNQNTQFIVITHRRGTMEEADVLYGVTMQDEGISKLLKMDPSEIGKQTGIQ